MEFTLSIPVPSPWAVAAEALLWQGADAEEFAADLAAFQASPAGLADRAELDAWGEAFAEMRETEPTPAVNREHQAQIEADRHLDELLRECEAESEPADEPDFI